MILTRGKVFIFTVTVILFLGILFPYVAAKSYAHNVLNKKLDSYHQALQERTIAITNTIVNEISKLKFSCDAGDIRALRDLDLYNTQFRVQGIELKNGRGCSSFGPDLNIVSSETAKDYVYKFRGYDVGFFTTKNNGSVSEETVAFINVNGNFLYWVLNGAWTYEQLQFPCKSCFYIEYLNVSKKKTSLFIPRGNPLIKKQAENVIMFSTLSSGDITYKLWGGKELYFYSLSSLRKYSLIVTLSLLVLVSFLYWLYGDYQSSMTAILRNGVKKKEFLPFYQPIVDASTGYVIGAEALLRWRTKGEIISPGCFIEHAEKSGLILDITEQLLERVMFDIERMPKDVWISINIVPEQIENGTLFNMLKKYDLKVSSRLRFEVTERMQVNDFIVAEREVLKIKSLGYHFKVDDFGTGYGGFSYIQRLGIDDIKIDKMFVDTIGTDDVKKSVLDSIIAFAKEANMEPVAEGVETQEQLNYLMKKGVNRIQGFLYSKPLPIDVFIEWVSANSGRL